MFSLNDTLKKSGSVGRWETKQLIGMALIHFFLADQGSGQVKESVFVLAVGLYEWKITIVHPTLTIMFS